MHLVGGAIIFGAFLLVYCVVTVYTLYTRRGSAISRRLYRNPGGPRAATRRVRAKR
jgi:hypothetical protein